MLKDFRTRQRVQKLNARNIFYIHIMQLNADLIIVEYENFNTNILHTNISLNTKISPNYVRGTCVDLREIFACSVVVPGVATGV